MAGKSYQKNWFTLQNIILYLVIGGLIYGAIYYFTTGNTGSSTYSTSPSTSTNQSKTADSTIFVPLGEQNGSGEEGKAMLAESGGKTTVTLTLNNAPSGPQPAHIHVGICPMPGAISYPLTNVVNGSSVTVLDVDLATLRSQLPLAINVHKSPAEAKVYVSCGDLK